MNDRTTTLLESMSNLVWCVHELGRMTVYKRYTAHGRRNGFCLPPGRAMLECIILKRMARFAATVADRVAIPSVLRFDADASLIQMSYLGGVPLCECEERFWPGPAAWRALGLVCARLERHSEDIANAVPRRVWEAQLYVRRQTIDPRISSVTPTQALLKAEYMPQLSAAAPVVCLGDLVLSNLLACDGRLGVIDFEFTHEGHAGFDVGRLAAQLSVRAVRSLASRTFLNRCRQALLDGYYIVGGRLDCAEMWEPILGCYYNSPDYAGPNVTSTAA